jgi:hypothetical protein
LSASLGLGTDLARDAVVHSIQRWSHLSHTLVLENAATQVVRGA